MNPRVFVLTPTQFDVANAGDYGEIVYLYGHNGKRLPSPLSAVFAEETFFALESQDYDPDTDYLLILGSQAALVQWTAGVISHYQYAKALIFDATTSQYVARLIGFEEIANEENPVEVAGGVA